jgi:hypothetical protein
MDIARALEIGNLLVDLLRVLLWPLILIFILLYFGKPLKQFADNLGEFTCRNCLEKASRVGR